MHAQLEQHEDAIDHETGEIVEVPRNFGGRPVGAKTRKKSADERMAQMGLDPIVKLACMAVKAEREGKDVLAMKIYVELAQYADAKKKSVEFTVEKDSPLEQALQLSSAERMLRVQALMQALGSN